jgi:hypothetical protein
METLARLGYGARGLLYVLVGGLAVLAALGSGGQVTGSRGALRTILGQPLGWVWLGLIGLALAAYALWRFVESTTDADRRGTSWTALAIRAVHIGSGFIYLGLAWFAVNLAFGWAATGGSEDKAAKDWTAWLMAKPFGPWLVIAVGIGVVAGGLGVLVKGCAGDFSKRLKASPTRPWIVPLARMGFMARGVVFCVAGTFLVFAGLHANPAEAQGLGGALTSLQRQPYGWLLLAITALGLWAYGLYGFAEAFYRRIDPKPI